MDPLSLLLNRLSVRARFFYSGNLCQQARYDAVDGGGHLHVMRSGVLRVRDDDGTVHELDRPSLLLYSGLGAHGLEPDPVRGADLVCASIDFEGDAVTPRLLGFPARLVVPLSDLPGLAETLEALFGEAFRREFGYAAAVDRLMEVLLVLLMRHFVARGQVDAGVLTGLADPRVAKALDAVHRAPHGPWTLESLADAAGMSRASFAARFKDRVGIAPGDYVTTLRLALARRALLAGMPLKRVAAQVGYASAATLTRVFRQRLGHTPREWLERERGRRQGR